MGSYPTVFADAGRALPTLESALANHNSCEELMVSRSSRDHASTRLRFIAAGGSLVLVAAMIVGFPTASHATSPAPDVTAFTYTGAAEPYAVPDGVDRVFFVAAGAAGGSSALLNGGFGGVVSGVIDVSSTDELSVRVGQQPVAAVGGFNGGGNGGAGSAYAGLGGGGATDIRAGGQDLADRIVVAGGGGGAAAVVGGNGGAPIGTDGASSGGSTSGGGGSDDGGGSAGTSNEATTPAGGGSAGLGGNGATAATTLSGGGGGGGYFGGGGGGVDPDTNGASSGGGGSSFASGMVTSSVQYEVSNILGSGYVWIVPLAAGSFVANTPTTSQFTATVTGPHDVLLVGASGGRARGMYSGQKPGAGASVRFTLQLTAGTDLNVIVGGAGAAADASTGGAGGYNGGGTGGNGAVAGSNTNGGSGGGGATDVRPVGEGADGRLGVAGGGGGAPTGGVGGSGGNPAANGSVSNAGGRAGTVDTPGAGGTGTIAGSGAIGATGGNGANLTSRSSQGGGGGGGGYTGGGGGAGGSSGGGGGGGFSYVPGPATDVSYLTLASTGSGFAIITPAAAGPLSFAGSDFGSATVGVAKHQTVTVTNDGDADVVPSAITPAGAGVALDASNSGTCVVGEAVAAGGECTVAVVWTPVAAGTLADASLTIMYPGGGSESSATAFAGTAESSGGGGGGGGGSVQGPVDNCVRTNSRMPASGIKPLQRPDCRTSADQRIGTSLKFTAKRGDMRPPRLRCQIGDRLIAAKKAPASYGRGAKICARGRLVLVTNKLRGRATVTFFSPATSGYEAYLKVITFRT